MKRVSLSQLAANAPPQALEAEPRAAKPRRAGSSKHVRKITSDEDNDHGQRVQVAFRMDKDAYRDLKRMAIDEDTTVNELMVRAINELRARKGLKKLAS
jgi:hypothetical protein